MLSYVIIANIHINKKFDSYSVCISAMLSQPGCTDCYVIRHGDTLIEEGFEKGQRLLLSVITEKRRRGQKLV